MIRYFLKDKVTEKILEERLFRIMETPVGRAAVRLVDDEDNAIIIVLDPPIREVRHRYPTNTKTIEEKIEDILDLVEKRSI